MKSSISGSDTPLFEAVTYARAWLTLRENINLSSSFGIAEEKWKLRTTKYGTTSIHPCLFSTLWKSWKTLSCNEVTTELIILDLNIGHEDSLLWSSVAFPPAQLVHAIFSNLKSHLQTSWKTSLEKIGRVQLSIALATTRHWDVLKCYPLRLRLRTW